MSALFFKVSWPYNVERYRELQKASKRLGYSLTVKNVSRKRGLPIFLFNLTAKDGGNARPFSSMDEVQAELEQIGARS